MNTVAPPPPPSPADPVDYAPHPPPWRRRKLVRRAAFGAAAVLVLLLAYSWGPTLWAHARLLHAQRRCLAAPAPPGMVVYEDDPARAAKLLASGGRYVDLKGSGVPVVWFADSWDRLYALLSPPGRKPAATLFLHGRTANGQRRLVAVDAAWMPGGRDVLNLTWTLVDPGTVASRPRIIRTGSFALQPTRGTQFRFFSGQLDPRDDAHFELPYEVDGEGAGVIDGWLRSDDIVTLEVRRGPTKTTFNRS